MSERYYRLELDDASAASFTSLGKYYYGTLDEIAEFISAFENDPKLKDNYRPLISAFKAYVAGDHQVKHIHSTANRVIDNLTNETDTALINDVGFCYSVWLSEVPDKL